jgi:hypothetical protein
MQEQGRHLRYMRWLYELLLAAYYALMFVASKDSFYLVLRLRRLPAPLLTLTRGLFSSDPSFNLQYLLWFLLSGTTFVFLRVLGQFRPLNAFLCQLVGSAVFLAPVFGGQTGWATRPALGWLWVEGGVTAATALFYANRRSPASVAFLSAAVVFHFGFWAFLYFGNIHWWQYWNWVAEGLLLPLLGSLVWGFYVWLLARPSPTR